MKKILPFWLLILPCFFFHDSMAQESSTIPEVFFLYKVKSGDTLSKIAPVYQWNIIKKVNRIDEKHLPLGKKILIPKKDNERAYDFCPIPKLIKDTNPRLVVIFLDIQYFGAYKNNKLEFWGPISSGASGYETPKGKFEVLWKKKKYFSKKYDNAAMPFSICISNQGYFLHQQSLVGKPASHGCVRLLKKDAKKIFYWVKIKDVVVIK